MSGASKVAIVTGAGSGIGRACALALAKDGFALALAGRRRAALDEVAQAIEADGGRALAVACDVADAAQVQALFDASEAAFGRLDLLFNNAGVFAPAVNLEDLDVDQWREVVDTNLTGAFLCTQDAFRLMKRQTPAGRPHHQQRLDLGACPAAEFGRLYGDEARDHRPHQVDLAGRTQVRYRLRPDRHRQCRRPT